jgi:hypothetical protein
MRNQADITLGAGLELPYTNHTSLPKEKIARLALITED